MGCFKKTKKTDYLRTDAAALANNVAEQAERAAQWVTPRVSKAREDLVRVANQTQDRIEPAYAQARARVLDDYLPRARRATSAVQAAAHSSGTVGVRAKRAAQAARLAAFAPVKPHKRHRVLKCFGWFTLATGGAVAAYAVWRHSQPIEDPWAEEYWADSTPDSAEPVSEFTEAASDLADCAADKAAEVKDAAKNAGADLADAVKDVTD